MRLWFVVAAVALGGCADNLGRDFARPAADAFVLGRTTPSDISARYGEAQQRVATVLTEGVAPAAALPGAFPGAWAPGNYAEITYFFSGKTKTFPLNAPRSVKILGFEFWNGVLVAYAFSSNFAGDSSNFDETNRALLKNGQTSKSEAVRLFGPPSGRAVYPEAARTGDERYIYVYSDARGDKRLELLFGSDDKLVDYRFTDEETPRYVARPSDIPFPIVILHRLR
jgi:hypothetical protein